MVDLRPQSASFGKWAGCELGELDGVSVFIPAGCAHGFVTLSEHTIISYLISGAFQPEAGRVLRWDDPQVNIDWPIKSPILSDKDATAPGWNECDFS